MKLKERKLLLYSNRDSNKRKARGKSSLGDKIFSRSQFSSCFKSFCSESTGNEDNTKNHKQEPKLSFLVKAIYTMAYGLQAYHEDVCGKDFVGVCPQLQKSFNHSIFFVRNHLKLMQIVH